MSDFKHELISDDLAQDTERLEWIIKHHVRITHYMTAYKDKHVYIVFVHNDEGFGVYSTHGNTPREAIDRAMREWP